MASRGGKLEPPLDIFLYSITASPHLSSASISEQIIFRDGLFVKACRCHQISTVGQTDRRMSAVMDFTEENTLGLPGFGYFPETVIDLLKNLTKVFMKAFLPSDVGCLQN